MAQRFGDHDRFLIQSVNTLFVTVQCALLCRLPHPTDCSLFYACLRNGSPRLLSCQIPTVFNAETGFCEDQARVPGCRGFYPTEENFVQQIREHILRDFEEAPVQ